MKPPQPINLACLALLAFLAGIIAWTVGDYGISWDEYFRWRGGDSKLRYYEALTRGDAQEVNKLRGNTDHYPGFFDLPLAAARQAYSGENYFIGHAWCAAFGLLGVAGAMALAYALGGSGAALLAGCLLALFPRYWGHLFINPKDIPFAATYVWGLWALGRVLVTDRRDWRSAVLFGVLAGACMAVRVGGLLLFCYAGLFYVIQLMINRTRLGALGLRHQAVKTAGWGGLSAVVAFFILFIFWPAAHQNPFTTAAGAVSEVTQFGWQGEVLFGGITYIASELPRYYMLEMLARLTPDWWWLLILSGSVFLLARISKWRDLRDHLDSQLVLFAIIFPVAFIMVKGSIVYDGARHLLFIIPPAAALLATVTLALLKALYKRWGRLPVIVLSIGVGALALLSVFDMARLHPYQYIYFNRLSGGLASANGRFETDYWGTAFREATEILAAELPARDRPWRVTMEPPLELLVERYGKAVVPPPALVEPFLGDHIELVRSHENPDFYIASTRNDYNEMRDGELLLAVSRAGVTLVEVKAFTSTSESAP